MLIGQNTLLNWNFKEFLVRYYQYTRNSFSSKTRILEKHTLGDTCGQHISKYSAGFTPKIHLL